MDPELEELQERLTAVNSRRDVLVTKYKASKNDASKKLSKEEKEEFKNLTDERETLNKDIKELKNEEKWWNDQVDEFDNQPRNQQPGSRRRARNNPARNSNEPKVVKDHMDSLREDPRKGFNTPYDFCTTIINAQRDFDNDGMYSGEDERLKILNAVGDDEHSTNEDAYGGFFVPTAFSPSPRELETPDDPLGSRVQRVEMTAPKVEIIARVDKDHRNSVVGGLQWFRRKEMGTHTSSRMKHEMVGLSANSLTGLSYVTDELMTDSPVSFAGILARGFRDALPDKLMRERIDGSGVGEMQGMLKAKGVVIPVDKETGQPADTILAANVKKMRQRAWKYEQCVWLINIDSYLQVCMLHEESPNAAGLIQICLLYTSDAADE